MSDSLSSIQTLSSQVLADHISVILVNTSHPGNIGSAARAMKTMGLSRLILVAPAQYPADQAYHLASGANDILDHAKVVATFDEAVADQQWIFGASARSRSIPWPVVSPRVGGEMILERLNHTPTKIALVFGREASGLTNEELMRCHYHLQIPSNPEYGVLNIAMAVQVITYEIWQTLQLRLAEYNHASPDSKQMPLTICRWDVDLASSQELHYFVEHLTQLAVEWGFYDPDNPKQIVARLTRLFLRAQPDKMELQLLRGLFASKAKAHQSTNNSLPSSPLAG
jgi:tRNA (cytidine32/uridine32-2'-O)-methyltransferase